VENEIKRSMERAMRAYTEDCAAKVTGSDFAVLSEIAAVIMETKHTGTRIFTVGNGGSAATASHVCNDLIKGCRVHNRRGFDAECLADSLPVVTCLSNDFSYEDVFRVQLETKAKAGDVLLAFSGSGDSENVVRAARTANAMGLTTCGFLGRDGGRLKPLCRLFVIAPTDSMEQLEDMHLVYTHALVSAIRAQLADLWDAEIVTPCYGRVFHTALFDFDGTVSLIRQGWQEIMIPYFIEVLRKVSDGEPEEETERIVRDFVDLLTGKQTIFQCMRLDEEVVSRGGAHVDPLVYKREYLRRLEEHIRERKAGLANGAISPEECLVPGCRKLVEALRERGIRCYLASGTDEADVLREARLLGIDGLFEGGIHGARDEMLECSKELVIRSLLRDEGVKPEELLSFGDGYVEIELVKSVGGYAVGVATEEARKKGVNEWKRSRLLSAGAGMIIPDFSNVPALLNILGV